MTIWLCLLSNQGLFAVELHHRHNHPSCVIVHFVPVAVVVVDVDSIAHVASEIYVL